MRIIISDDGLKEHTEIINGEKEDHIFLMNSMEQTIKIFSRSCQNKNSGKGDIRTDIHFQQMVLMAMIDPSLCKKIKLFKVAFLGSG